MQVFNPSTVRAEMARKSITIAELAERTGLASSAIAKILGNEGNPTIKSLIKIAAALAVDVRIFFDDTLHDSVSAESESLEQAV